MLLQSAIDKLAALTEGFTFFSLRTVEPGGLVVGSASAGIVVLLGSQGGVEVGSQGGAVVGSQGIVVSC